MLVRREFSQALETAKAGLHPDIMRAAIVKLICSYAGCHRGSTSLQWSAIPGSSNTDDLSARIVSMDTSGDQLQTLLPVTGNALRNETINTDQEYRCVRGDYRGGSRYFADEVAVARPRYADTGRASLPAVANCAGRKRTWMQAR